MKINVNALADTVIIGRGNFREVYYMNEAERIIQEIKDGATGFDVSTVANLISEYAKELAAVKAEQNHQNKGVMDLQDKYDKVVADRDRLKALLKKYVPLHYHDHDYWHDDCGLCQSEKEIYSDVKQALESDGE